MSARRPLPPPGGGDDLAAALGRRLSTHDQDGPQGASDRTDATGGTARTERTARTGARDATGTTGGAGPVRRSWYMTAGTAQALTAAVDDLHFATRRPKAEVLAVLVGLALEHLDEAARRLAV